MKKFLALLLLLTLVFVGFACGEDKKEDDKKQDDNQQEEVKEFTVKFVADGKEVTKQTVKEGEKASKPADPVKEGYTFVGWFVGDKEYDFGAVTADVTVTAKFEEVKPEVKEYTVTFVVDGEKTEVKVAEGEKAVKPSDPVKEGYVFKGWYVGEEAYDFEKAVTADVELVAVFEENGEEPGDDPVVEYPDGFEIELEATYESVYIDETKKAVAVIVKPEGVTVEGLKYVWSSSDEEVLYVNPETGAVKGIAEGEATIICTTSDEEYSCELTIQVLVRPALESIVLEGNTSVDEGATTNLTVVCTPADALADVDWSSDNEAVATVNDKGIVMGIAAGTAVITATQKDNAAITATFTVTVNPKVVVNVKPERIEVSGSATATVGYTVEFKATVYPAQANQNVKWKSINENILSIDPETGVGTALKTGKARVRAYSALDESIQSAIFTVEIKEEVKVIIPDMQGYEIVIMNASSALTDLDPFLDGYSQVDKMYKQMAWREVEKDFNCTISVKPYPDSAPWGPARVSYIIDNAANGQSTADISIVSNLWLHQFANDSANAAVNVSDYFVKYGKDQMTTVLREAGSYKGQLYVATQGISKTQTYVDLGLYYNLAWVEKLGVKDPATMFNDGEWNYTGFKNWCLEVQALLNSEAGEYALSGHPFYYWLGMTNAAGVKVADSMTLQVNLDSQRSKDASSLMYQITSNGAFDTAYTWAENDGGFIAGTAVMTTGYLWFVRNSSRWKDDVFGADTRFGYVPFPYPDDMAKEDTRVSQSEASLLLYTAGREGQYPAELKIDDVYYAMTELYLRTIKYQEADPTFDAEQVVYDSLSKRVDNQESIEAIRWFDSGRVFYDPVYVGYTSNSDTPLNTPAINTMIKGNDYAQEFDAVKESYETKFKSIFAS